MKAARYGFYCGQLWSVCRLFSG